MATITCPSCKQQQPDDVFFCRNCGYNLQPVAQPAPFASTPIAALAQAEMEDVTITSEQGKYKLLDQTHEGGHSLIFLAKWIDQNRSVCIKRIKPEAVEFGKQEIEILSRIEHPNIIELFDVAKYEDSDCLVLEYLSGGTLLDAFRRGARFSPNDTNSIIQQIAAALTYLHENNVTHCDVKPGNVFLDGMRVVLADFGISQDVTEDSAEDMPIAGTP